MNKEPIETENTAMIQEVGEISPFNNNERKVRSLASQRWRFFTRHKPAMLGLIVFLTLALASISVDRISPYDPERTNLSERLNPPSLRHPMGTDDLGRDVLTRVLYGGRISLSVSLLSMVIAITFGTIIGAFSGFLGGWVDNVLMRFTDMMLSFPNIFILIILSMALRTIEIEAFTGTPYSAIFSIVIVIAALAWMVVARLVRASFLSIKEKEYIEAARCLGVPRRRIMFKHMLPNAASPIIVAATFRLAAAITAESGLSYLGFGVQPPTPTWGNMLRVAQDEMARAPWTAIFPGLAIFITVIAINFIGDGIRDAFDPHKIEK